MQKRKATNKFMKGDLSRLGRSPSQFTPKETCIWIVTQEAIDHRNKLSFLKLIMGQHVNVSPL
jgi:hypothetical protein